MAPSENPAITVARRAYAEAGKLLDVRTAERSTAKQALTDALARMGTADDLWETAAAAVDNTFEVLRQLVAESASLPEYDPLAEAVRAGEVFDQAADDYAKIEREET